MIVAMYLHEMTQLSTLAWRGGDAAGDGLVNMYRASRPPVAAWQTRSYSFRVPVNFMLKKERVGELGGRRGGDQVRSLRTAASVGPLPGGPLGGERR